MVKMTTSRARQEFSVVLKGARRGKRFLLQRHGQDVAAIVSVEDLALLQAIEDRKDARAALADAKENGTVPWEHVKAELGL